MADRGRAQTRRVTGRTESSQDAAGLAAAAASQHKKFSITCCETTARFYLIHKNLHQIPGFLNHRSLLLMNRMSNELLKGAEVVRKTQPVAQSRKHNLDESPSITSSGSHSELRSESVLPQSSNHGITVFHPSHFMEMTHPLGLDLSGLNSAFETPAYRTWPSNDSPFAGMQEDAVRRATMLVRA
ncbi:hypothetical protein K439DRAFT_1633948 [Ramaria rubella]|nr:hypothetical protein K439DRAFT_1633948 [Ramaria rubella]